MTGYQPVTIRLLARESWGTQFPIGEKVGKNWTFAAEDIETILARKKRTSIIHQEVEGKMEKMTRAMSQVDPLVMELWQSNRNLILKQKDRLEKMQDALWDLRKTMAALAERIEN